MSHTASASITGKKQQQRKNNLYFGGAVKPFAKMSTRSHSGFFFPPSFFNTQNTPEWIIGREECGNNLTSRSAGKQRKENPPNVAQQRMPVCIWRGAVSGLRASRNQKQAMDVCAEQGPQIKEGSTKGTPSRTLEAMAVTEFWISFLLHWCRYSPKLNFTPIGMDKDKATALKGWRTKAFYRTQPLNVSINPLAQGKVPSGPASCIS